MATRFLLPASALPAGTTPAVDAAWEDSSILVRSICKPTSISDAMATVSFTDSDDTDKDIIFRQYISSPITTGTTITGSQALKSQIRGMRGTLAGVNLFTSLGIRVISNDAVPVVRKTVLAVTRDNTAMPLTTLTNRQFTATSAATDYVTVAGDRLCIELGIGGDPEGLTDHDADLRFGDAAAADLAEDDSSTTDNRPWVELTDTLTFFGAEYPYVQAAADDGTWYTTGLDTNLTNGDLMGDQSGGSDPWIGSFFRVDNVPIPKGATILTAKITFMARSNSPAGVCRLRIKAVDEDDATAPTTFADAQGRSVTTAFVDWTPSAWTINTAYDSADFTAVMQEVIDRAGWASGNAFCMYFLDNASDVDANRRSYKYDDGATNQAYLTITFTAPSGTGRRSGMMMRGIG